MPNFRNRDLSATLGRWLQQDPLGYVDGSNLYEFVASNPARQTDPSGLQGGMPPRADKEFQACRQQAFARDQLRSMAQTCYSVACVMSCIKWFSWNQIVLGSCIAACAVDLVYSLYTSDLQLQEDLQVCADELKERLDKQRPGQIAPN